MSMSERTSRRNWAGGRKRAGRWRDAREDKYQSPWQLHVMGESWLTASKTIRCASSLLPSSPSPAPSSPSSVYHFHHTHLPHLVLALFSRHFSPISLFLIFWIQDLVEEEHTHAHTKVLHHYGFSYFFLGWDVGHNTLYPVSLFLLKVFGFLI